MRELCSNDTREWYALRVLPRHEKSASELLATKGYESVLPLHRTQRAWSDRTAWIDMPVFPQYLISRFGLTHRADVFRTPGVIGVVTFGGRPEPLSQSDMVGLRAMMESGLSLQPWPYLAEGTSIRIVAGPLRGLTGKVIRNKSALRVVVDVDLLQRSISVEIDQDALERWSTATDGCPTDYATLSCPGIAPGNGRR